MKKSLYGIVLLMLCLGINLSSSWAQSPSGPKMVLKEKSFDFNEVDEGKILEHHFKVLNAGDRPLKIKWIKPG